MLEQNPVQLNEETVQEDTSQKTQELIVSELSQEQIDDSSWGDILRGTLPLEDKATLKGEYGPAIYIYQDSRQFNNYGNYLKNSGIIFGGVSQQQETSVSADNPSGESETEDYVRQVFRNSNPTALASLITITTLEPIPENIFHQTAQILCDSLMSEWTEEEKYRTRTHFQTVPELLSPFLPHRLALPISYGPANLEIKCWELQDKLVSERIRKQVWQDYVQLRPIMTEWLLKLRMRTTDASSRLVGYTAMQGLANYAALDIEYSYIYLIPALEQWCTTQSDVKYLVAFVEQLMQWEPCWPMVDELLCQWCRGKSHLLWQIPYRLYGREGKWRFQEEVPKILLEKLRQDLSREGMSSPKWYKKDRGFFLYPAHENHATAALLAEQIATCFSLCKYHKDRYHMAVHFLSLLRWDYLTDFSATPELVFLRAFYQNEVRQLLLPLFRFALQNVDLRNVFFQVLTCHMKELVACSAPYSYLEKPFEYLAFTGKRIDYSNTMYFLKRCAKQKETRPIAEHLVRYLSCCLEKRSAAINQK